MKGMTAVVGIGGVLLGGALATFAMTGGPLYGIAAILAFGFGWLFLVASQFLKN